jgi:hypothetical protein
VGLGVGLEAGPEVGSAATGPKDAFDPWQVCTNVSSVAFCSAVTYIVSCDTTSWHVASELQHASGM